MMPGTSSGPLRRAIASLSAARLDLMAVKRGATVEEWNDLDRAVEAVDEAIRLAERARSIQEGRRRRWRWRRYWARAPTGRP